DGGRRLGPSPRADALQPLGRPRGLDPRVVRDRPLTHEGPVSRRALRGTRPLSWQWRYPVCADPEPPALGSRAMDDALTRRQLVGAGAAGAALLALRASPAPAAARRRTRRADVCVVGAGLSGLAAARALVAAGHSV